MRPQLHQICSTIGLFVGLVYTGALAAQDAPAAQAPVDPPAVSLTGIEQMLGADMVKVAQIARSTWSTVLIGDPTKPVVTVGTVAGGIVLLGLAYLAASMISRWLASKL